MAPFVISQIPFGVELASAFISTGIYLLRVDPTMNFQILLLTKLGIASRKVTFKRLGALVEVNVSSESYFASKTFCTPRVVACEPFLGAAHRQGSLFLWIKWYIWSFSFLPLIAPSLCPFGLFKFMLIRFGYIDFCGFCILGTFLIIFFRLFIWLLARRRLRKGTSSSLYFFLLLLVAFHRTFHLG